MAPNPSFAMLQHIISLIYTANDEKKPEIQ